MDSGDGSHFYSTIEPPQLEGSGLEGFIRPADPFRKTGEGVSEELEDLGQRLRNTSQPWIVDANDSASLLDETVLGSPEEAMEISVGDKTLEPEALEPHAGSEQDPQVQDMKTLMLSDIDSDIPICIESTESQSDYVSAKEELSGNEEGNEEAPLDPPVRKSTRIRKRRNILTYDHNYEPKIVQYGALNLICIKYED